jgi:tRNA threonylcarbamoyladenosine biosynthesis protein TsaE
MDRSTTAAPATGSRRSDSPQRTRALGRALGAAAQPGTVLALVGPLGAGKTELAKGVAEGLGVRSVVNSPTFILMNEHAGRLPFFHIDAYRLSDPDEALAAGLLDERQGQGVTVVEWADRLGGVLPVERLELVLTPDADGGEGRLVAWRATDAQHAALAAATLGAA